jgi:Ca-activated chloride channel family protein
MHYAYPQLTWLGLLAGGLLAGLLVVAAVRRRRALRRLAEAPTAEPLLLVSRPRQLIKAALMLAAAGLLAFTVLGPQWGELTEEVREPSAPGRDVLVVLDVSRSMSAEDVAPSRLGRAKADVRDLAASLEKQGGYRIGLVAFADRASLLCPLTSDFRCFEEELSRASLETLRLRGDGGEAGTQIGAGLQRAAETIGEETAPYTDVVLISDGGDMETDTLAAADLLAKKGVAAHVLGLGDPNQGALIPVTRPDGTRGHLKYQGELVRSKLEEDVLKQIASRTGGQYVAAGTGFVELDRWFGSAVASKTSRELESAGQSRTYVHRFQWFLAPAVGLLLLHLLVRDGRRRAAGPVARVGYFLWVRRRRRAAETGAPAERR